MYMFPVLFYMCSYMLYVSIFVLYCSMSPVGFLYVFVYCSYTSPICFLCVCIGFYMFDWWSVVICDMKLTGSVFCLCSLFSMFCDMKLTGNVFCLCILSSMFSIGGIGRALRHEVDGQRVLSMYFVFYVFDWRYRSCFAT